MVIDSKHGYTTLVDIPLDLFKSPLLWIQTIEV